ncbi:MAG: aldehyde dehydrogenase [Rhodospirillaceae bacterium]|jgi:thiamine pyrophosphate-dependent acetolactate synthase large subunit-like protein|nr:aldehyde dehydrogenase [Rhodospirillaceae bacterium]MBT3627613.1 aldehyde dehydrogenase [Rhodospirillaceae bacterium]MBT4428535.1 aldehyde dehydrogenase [Rhodospirillaceae bacterium]MBT5674323.1 aldehyde dehydrogenase [Rhodospirillaceae bacterium]MBT5779027.1 aldehyde dehydrogenase [Rhodospirillaceae bacterium]
MAREPDTQLARRDVVRDILAGRGGALVIGGLGSPAWDCAAVENNPLDFLLWGAMGNAASIGLGLAQAQPERRVLVITGDGDLTMGLGSLAAIGSAGVANLAIVVLDNERYGETGMQPSHTAQHLDLAGVAESCGFAETRLVNDQAGLDVALPIIHQAPGPVAIIVKIKAEDLPRVLPPRDGAFLKDRFRAALLGEEQAQA